MKNKAVVAVARELTGFVWAIGREVQTSGWKGIKLEPVGVGAALRRPNTNTADQGEKTGGAQTQRLTQMPEGERGAAAATGEPSKTLLVGQACGNACRAISDPRAKAAPRRKSVLR